MKLNRSRFYGFPQKIRRSRVLSGALLLTAAGMLSRVIGFFYRIFLSRRFGAEQIGIYQLIGPVMALSYSLTAAGFQSAISRITAAVLAPAGRSFSKKKSPSLLYPYSVLAAGMLLSLLLSVGISWVVYRYADNIAAHFLLEARSAPLLRILALSFPVSAIHSCANGFFFGRKSANFPAFSQLLEQLARVGTVLLLCAYVTAKTAAAPNISLAVTGMVVGEITAATASLLYLLYCYRKEQNAVSAPGGDDLLAKPLSLFWLFPKLLAMAIPLSAGRVIQNLLQSVEAVAIPERLRMFGMDTASALSEYGILTGMALPFVLFPTALTGSIALMLLPTVSEAQALHQERTIAKAVRRCAFYCLLLGFACLVFFLFFGPFLGKFIFHQKQAGLYLQILGFMCPFLYMNSTLSSILHGLGRTVISFFYSVASLLLRLLFVFFCIPVCGIKGYLWALLSSQLLLSALQLFSLRKYLRD